MDPQDRIEDYRPDVVDHDGGKYFHNKELGRGAFGIVYLYEEKDQPYKKLAIKVENLKANRSHGSVMTKESYYLRMMNDKNCDRVIGYYGDGFCSTAQYMKLEYIDMTLEAYVKDPTIPGKRSISDIASQMLDCLKQMHKAGYLHQDVKTDNFMISKADHKVRVLDMGLVMEYIRDGSHKSLGKYGF
jgi:serine/threonine protein kinase